MVTINCPFCLIQSITGRTILVIRWASSLKAGAKAPPTRTTIIFSTLDMRVQASVSSAAEVASSVLITMPSRLASSITATRPSEPFLSIGSSFVPARPKMTVARAAFLVLFSICDRAVADSMNSCSVPFSCPSAPRTLTPNSLKASTAVDSPWVAS